MTDLQPIFGIADKQPLIIAGPCSAESLPQTLATAEALADLGISVFRAGLWKPRTKPGSFEGVGAIGLPWLAEVKARTGMLTVTEVATAAHLKLALEAGIDGVWIGARTAANPFAVQELADAIAALPAHVRARLTVLVKNPVNPDLELWLGALQRIYAAGIRRLGAVHRGFSSYGKHLYRNSPLWRIPIELHRRIPALTILCDPSHIAGDSALVPSLARQAMTMRFDGLIIETHINPTAALSDAAQQLTPALLASVKESLRPGATADDNDAELTDLRRTIDAIDDELLDVLARRMEVARQIGRYKNSRAIPVVQPVRYNALMQKRIAQAQRLGLSPDFISNLLAAVHEESVRQQL